MKTITVFKGDGIGPEITDAVLSVLKAAHAPLEYDIYNVGEAEYEKTELSYLMPVSTHLNARRCSLNHRLQRLSVRVSVLST